MGERLAALLFHLPDRYGDAGWWALKCWFRATRSFPLRDCDGKYKMLRATSTAGREVSGE